MMRRPTDSRSRFAATTVTAAVTTALFLLSGCAVGPDYQRPEVSLPDAFRTAPGGDTATTAALVEKAWWRLFQDEVLNGLIEQAQRNNFDVLAAVARVEEAEGLAREAQATFFPQVDLKASDARSQLSTKNASPIPATVPSLQDSRKAGLSTSFELDLWGKLRRAHESARADVLATRYAREALDLSVAGLVANGYFGLRAADANLTLTESTLESRRKTLAIVRSKHEAGNASPLDLNQAEGAVALAEAQLADLRRQRSLAENQLGLLTGQPGLRITPADLRKLPLPPLPPAGLPSSLLEARPDLRQAEEALVSANARIGVAKAALFPSLSLTGNLGSESAALSNLFTGSAGVWSLGLAATMPIFDAGRNTARIDQATARQKQALANYQKAVQSAFKDVNDALVNLQGYREAEQAQDRRAKAADRTLELAQIRYDAGYAGFLEVLDAQRSANDAQLSLVGARQARLNSTVDVFKALGGGWKDEHAAGENRLAVSAAPAKASVK